MTIGCRILHLTDFHWDEKTANDQKIILSKLTGDIARAGKDRKIDVLVFSGDLVNAGAIDTSFAKAKAELLDKVRDTFSLSDDDILICPGNHDVDRQLAVSQRYVEPGLKIALKDVEALNKHVDSFLDKPIEEDEACFRQANYFRFARTHYNKNASLQSSYVDCVTKKTPFGHIGFALFNSAWRSTGAGPEEQHKMLLADRVVDKAAEQLKGCDFRIAVMHHPLDWLAPWNSRSVRTPLFLNFDLVLFGHVHEQMPTLEQNAIGECLFAQGGALYLHREYYNGYHLIDLISNDGVDVDFHLRTWFESPRRDFGAAENICHAGRCLFHLRAGEQSKKLKIQDLLAIQAATDALATAHLKTLQLASDIGFDESFTCPPLSHKPHIELVRLKPEAYQSNLLELSSIIADDAVLVFCGAKESGKTTIAWKVAKEILSRAGTSVKIPIFVDFSILKKYDALDRIVRRHIAALNVEVPASLLLGNYRCVFIVDNVSIADPQKIERLKGLIAETKNRHDWCLFIDEVNLVTTKSILDEFGATKPPIYIQPFGRTEIRELVRKVSPSKGEDAIDFANTIIKLMRDNDLPRNPYIVTVLSSVLANISIEAVINEATLLDKMIDLLLNKQDPSNLLRSSTDFAGQNIILEQIAFWLKGQDSFVPENDLLGRLADFLIDRGIQESAAALLSHFKRVGLLDRREDDICFRYRSLESYFLARYYARNKESVPELLENVAILKYGKEFSLLCDLSRKDADLLSYLEVIILELEPRIFGSVDKSAFLKVDVRGSAEAIVDKALDNISSGPQTLRRIDDMYDLSDRAAIAFAAKIKETPPDFSAQKPTEEQVQTLVRFAGYVQAWQCWGRALTSLDFVQLTVRKPSFIKLLDHWARLASLASEIGHQVSDYSISESKKLGKAFSEDAAKLLDYLVRVYIPLYFAQSIFEHIGASSINQLVIEVFDELDLQAPEALGATCILIRHRPPGWSERVKRYLDAAIKVGGDTINYFLLTALHFEYYFRYLSPADSSAMEGHIAHLLNRAGFRNEKTENILGRIEKNRPRIELLTRDLRSKEF